MEEIDFSGTRITRLTGIGAANKLKVLKGARNALYATELQDELFALSDLVHLDISGCGLVGSISSGIASLSNLEVFEAEKNDLSGELPDGLFRLQKLRRLVLSENNFVGNKGCDINQRDINRLLKANPTNRTTAESSPQGEYSPRTQVGEVATRQLVVDPKIQLG